LVMILPLALAGIAFNFSDDQKKIDPGSGT
jgi:hypothetical protein